LALPIDRLSHAFASGPHGTGFGILLSACRRGSNDHCGSSQVSIDASRTLRAPFGNHNVRPSMTAARPEIFKDALAGSNLTGATDLSRLPPTRSAA
jgi:hypothetical protein